MASETTENAARRQAIQQRIRARRELELFVRRLGILLGALLLLILAGTAGYAISEGTSGAIDSTSRATSPRSSVGNTISPAPWTARSR